MPLELVVAGAVPVNVAIVMYTGVVLDAGCDVLQLPIVPPLNAPVAKVQVIVPLGTAGDVVAC